MWVKGQGSSLLYWKVMIAVHRSSFSCRKTKNNNERRTFFSTHCYSEKQCFVQRLTLNICTKWMQMDTHLFLKNPSMSYINLSRLCWSHGNLITHTEDWNMHLSCTQMEKMKRNYHINKHGVFKMTPLHHIMHRASVCVPREITIIKSHLNIYHYIWEINLANARYTAGC